VVLGGVLACGCGRSNPDVIRDATGATFDWSCAEDGCTATEHDGTPPAIHCGISGTPHYNYGHGRLVVIGAAGLPEQDRLVVCESDDECPQWDDDEFECRNGLCQNVDLGSHPLINMWALALCFNERTRPGSCFAQFDDPNVIAVFELVAGTCPIDGPACTVPPSCRQP
jgi:hypothetical protein